MEGKLICPNCGSEVRLPEKSSLTFGMTLSKECGGTHYLELEKVNNENAKNNIEELYDIITLYDKVYIGMEDVSITYRTGDAHHGIKLNELVSEIKDACNRWENDATVKEERLNGCGYYPSEHKTAPCRIVVSKNGLLLNRYFGCYSDVLTAIRNDKNIIEFSTNDGYENIINKIENHFGIKVNKITNTEKENKSMTKAQERIEVLKNRGIDVTNYFVVNDDTVIKLENGVATVVPMADDPIVKQIVSDGEVFNARLDGRWIMAQMFHMLSYENRYRRGKGYNDALNDKGYMYQWEMLVGRNHGKWTGELLRLEARERDGEDLSIKGIWFNNETIEKMIVDYIICLRRYINSLPTYLCKKTLEYKRLGNRYERITGKKHGDIFVSDLEKLYDIYRKYASKAKYARNYNELVKIVKGFKRDIVIPCGHVTLNKYFKMSQAFKDAYKGNGAYYTAANLIRFHGCTVVGYNKEESLKYLNDRANEGCGWKLLGFLRELIVTNEFDFDARMSELNI